VIEALKSCECELREGTEARLCLEETIIGTFRIILMFFHKQIVYKYFIFISFLLYLKFK